MLDIAAEVRTFFESVSDARRLVFFVGAGISVPAGYPLWGTATKAAVDRAVAKGLDTTAAAYARSKYEKQQYYEVFQILQDELPEAEFYGIAEAVFKGGDTPAQSHRLLARLSAEESSQLILIRVWRWRERRKVRACHWEMFLRRWHPISSTCSSRMAPWRLHERWC